MITANVYCSGVRKHWTKLTIVNVWIHLTRARVPLPTLTLRNFT